MSLVSGETSLGSSPAAGIDARSTRTGTTVTPGWASANPERKAGFNLRASAGKLAGVAGISQNTADGTQATHINAAHTAWNVTWTAPVAVGTGDSRVEAQAAHLYGGTKVRFRLVGGTFRIRVVGTGVNLSVVGKGQVTLHGAGTADDGSYSVNGEPYADVPDLSQFALSASSP